MIFQRVEMVACKTFELALIFGIGCPPPTEIRNSPGTVTRSFSSFIDEKTSAGSRNVTVVASPGSR
jgi:hypothetical protein